jgi:predicted nucleic acid-binding Zn ribbon protein
MSDPPATVCETCGAGPVEKVLFPVAVHFKGSGFYATDYGRGSRKTAATDGDTGSGSGDSAPAKDKPAATADPKKSDSPTSDT